MFIITYGIHRWGNVAGKGTKMDTVKVEVGRFGAFFKDKRIELRKTLRQFANENGLDPGNLSKLERGILPPPTNRTKIVEYAELLRIKEGSDDWITFFDLASAEIGRIPKELLSDQDVVDNLPIFFRTMRGQKVSEEKLQELIKLIKGK